MGRQTFKFLTVKIKVGNTVISQADLSNGSTYAGSISVSLMPTGKLYLEKEYGRAGENIDIYILES